MARLRPTTRQILANQDNVSVFKAEVTGIDTKHKTVTAELSEYTKVFSYDSLIISAAPANPISVTTISLNSLPV